MTRAAPALWLAIATMWIDGASAETLQQYAAKCDAAVGFTVPDFDCDAGTLVPTTNHHMDTGTCDRPNRLNQECDPGSRFQVLTNNDSAHVVAHCRKRKKPDDGQYSDIAVIQHNRKSGATCFYQALEDYTPAVGRLPAKVKAPSKGQGNFWISPAVTAAEIRCAGCHDNGALVRSPYLAQLKAGPNSMPGAGDFTFNSDQPYFFIGEDFSSWKVYQVEVSNNKCNTCHRMGVSNIGFPQGRGTALDFGLRATAQSEVAKNPHGKDSPIWMRPGQIFYDANSEAAAKAIHDCALKFNPAAQPNGPDCKITEYTGTAPPAPFFVFAQHNNNFLMGQLPSSPGVVNRHDIVLVQGAKLAHYGLASEQQDAGWRKVADVYDATQSPAASPSPPRPIAISVVAGAADHPASLEAVARLRPVAHVRDPAATDYLALFRYDPAGKTWQGPSPILVDGKAIDGVTGDPALIRSTLGAKTSLELVVPRGDRIVHYRRSDMPGSPWQATAVVYDGTAVAADNSVSVPPIPEGAALIQSNYGNLEVVARLTPRLRLPGNDTSYLAHLYFDAAAQKWHGPQKMSADGAPITGVTGNPSFLQSTLGKAGNFELAVPQGNKVVHYSRDNDAAALPWRKVADVFDAPVNLQGSMAVLPPLPVAVSIIQSGTRSSMAFEALVQMTSRAAADSSPDYLSYFQFDPERRTWTGPIQFHVDGHLATVSSR